LLFVCLCIVQADFLADKIPVIGIFSTINEGPYDGTSYIKTTYPEFVAAGGANSIPIPWDLEKEQFYTLLDSVNGVLLTGGMAELWATHPGTGARRHSDYQLRVNEIVAYSIAQKKKGISFPIWGVCQGFEAVTIAVTNDPYLMDIFLHKSVLGEVTFTPAAKTSRMFSAYTEEDFEYVQSHPTFLFGHMYGINTSVPTLYPSLGPKNYVVTGTTKDTNGKEFISAMESIDYPIFIYMMHPERAIWDSINTPGTNMHPPEAPELAKRLSKGLTAEGLKNDRRFVNSEFEHALSFDTFTPEDVIFKGHNIGLHYSFTKDC
jgi:gamma-glutamyl hydrolase